MAIALVQEIVNSDDEKSMKQLLEQLREILSDSKSLCNNNRKNLELKTKHCRRLFAPAELPTDFSVDLSCLSRRKSISHFLDYNSSVISQFFCWIFKRRYGWNEKCPTDYEEQLNNSFVNDGDLTKLCEGFIVWFENHDHLSYYLLRAYRSSIKSCSCSPVVRKHTILSFFRWLRNLSHKWVILPAKCFAVLQDVVLLGLTDVWSAIRKDTTSRLGLVFDMLTLEQMEALSLSLINICNDDKNCDEDKWQATEGAIRGIYKFLLSCKWVATSSVLKKIDTKTSPSALIKLGRNHFTTLPPFIQDHLERILFNLFAHSQLTVRELAGKAFSAFLYKSEYAYFIESFEKVVIHLGKYANKDNECGEFMNAYEAEGFTNAVLFLIKNVPLVHLLSRWEGYWPIFSHYLIHPASTVRQTASHIFKYLVSKDLSSPLLLKLVMQSLCAGWNTNIIAITENLHSTRRKSFQKNHNLEVGDGAVWEWREGRLLAYELILKFLVTNYLYFSLSSINRRKEKHLTASLSVSHSSFSLDNRDDKGEYHKTLTRSLTAEMLELSRDDCFEKDDRMVESLISLCMAESFGDGEFLTESVPSLKLTRPPDIAFDLSKDRGNQHAAEKAMMKWLARQSLCSFRIILKQILIESVECLYESRWELRRMAHQLLPIVCDVIRYYDYSLLEDFYDVCIGNVDTVSYQGCCLCLLYCLKWYVKEKHHSERGNKLSELKRKQTENIMEKISTSLHKIVHTVADNVTKSEHWEIKETSIELLILYRIHFDSQVENLDLIICVFIENLYCNTNSEINGLAESNQNFRKDQLHFFSQILPLLCDYSKIASSKYEVFILPILLQCVYIYESNSLDVATLLNCAEVILQRVRNDPSMYISEIHDVLISVCNECCCIIQKADIEVQHTKETLNIILIIRLMMGLYFPFDSVLFAANSRLKLLESDVSFEKHKEDSDDESRGIDSVQDAANRNFNHNESRVSFSFSSCDSNKSGESDDDEDEIEENDTGSDWDWSSDGENNIENDLALQEELSTFISKLAV